MEPTELAKPTPRYANEVNLSAEERDRRFTAWVHSHDDCPALPQVSLTRVEREEEENADD